MIAVGVDRGRHRLKMAVARFLRSIAVRNSVRQASKCQKEMRKALPCIMNLHDNVASSVPETRPAPRELLTC